MTAIELRDLTVEYGDVTAVDDVTLRVHEGELLVLVGPSGCGKTSLLRTIAGLTEPTEGEVAVGGRRVTDLPARKRDVSLVFQDFALFPHLSVRENLSFDLRMQGGEHVERRTREVAELLEIEDLLDRAIDELSGGQKQRVALGRAIATEPTAFLLDEPLANLDASLRERMQTEIARLQDRLGVATVHVTHDQSEALTMGDRIAVVNDGHVEQVGPPETVYQSPATLFVARFVGSPSMNCLRGTHDPKTDSVEVTASDAPFTVPVGLPDDATATDSEVVVGVRPEHLAVTSDPSDAEGWSAGAGWIDATVAFEAFQGADRFLYLDAPGLPELVARVSAEAMVEEGDAVSVRFPPDRLHCFDAETGDRLRTTGTAQRALERSEDPST